MGECRRAAAEPHLLADIIGSIKALFALSAGRSNLQSDSISNFEAVLALGSGTNRHNNTGAFMTL